DLVEQAITPATRMLFVETPTNPILTLTDLRQAADLAHRRNLRLVVDNTFASPYVQRPIEFGADIVTHSTTKYLNGHSDSVGGVETLISHPATMTHASVPDERRAALGISDGLVRISAGIEDIEDLKEDLAQALDTV